MRQTARFCIGILIFISLAGCVDSSETENNQADFSVSADKVNPIDREFPGGRGADELVVYTSRFGDSTGTNKYGIEAIVVNNVIRKVGGNNSRIPEDGFVLSAHGKMSRWISEHLYPGLTVVISDKTLNFKETELTQLTKAKYLLQQAAENLNKNGQHISISADTVSRLIEIGRGEIEKSQQAIAANQDATAKTSAGAALDNARAAYYQSIPSQTSELRACWYRLKEKTPAELEATIRQYVEIGFNAICPEVIFGGTAIYPNAHPDLPQHPDFQGWDPLAELVRLCKKYEIKLVAWVWVYHVGRKDRSPLVATKADWLALSRQQEHPSQVEKGYNFLCPSREEVQTFWLEVYSHMLRTYEIDGLQLDYIRYPVSLPTELGYCYCGTCRADFQAKYAVDPLKITPENHPEKWQQWYDYRVDKVNRFVGKAGQLVDTIAPDVALSADVFPIVEESIASKCQNWGYWLENGFLDEIYTMSYTHDAQTVLEESQYLAKKLPDNIPGYVGLGPFMGFRPELLLEQISNAQSSGVAGITLFNYDRLTPEMIDALRQGPFRRKATLP